MMDVLEDLRLNHLFCQKEILLAAADEIEFLRKWKTEAELCLAVFMIVGTKSADDEVWSKNLARASILLKGGTNAKEKTEVPESDICTDFWNR